MQWVGTRPRVWALLLVQFGRPRFWSTYSRMIGFNRHDPDLETKPWLIPIKLASPNALPTALTIHICTVCLQLWLSATSQSTILPDCVKFSFTIASNIYSFRLFSGLSGYFLFNSYRFYIHCSIYILYIFFSITGVASSQFSLISTNKSNETDCYILFKIPIFPHFRCKTSRCQRNSKSGKLQLWLMPIGRK